MQGEGRPHHGRNVLGPERIVGVTCGASRDRAITASEAYMTLILKKTILNFSQYGCMFMNHYL